MTMSLGTNAVDVTRAHCIIHPTEFNYHTSYMIQQLCNLYDSTIMLSTEFNYNVSCRIQL